MCVCERGRERERESVASSNSIQGREQNLPNTFSIFKTRAVIRIKIRIKWRTNFIVFLDQLSLLRPSP
jgi:hypothetical protein